jgi:large subunit ribosomal protein L9
MDIILNEDVRKLGKVGDVVKVKDGYARNFLIPRKLASLATLGNRKRVALQKAKKAHAYDRARQDAQHLADKLAKISCTVTVEVNDRDKLYGAVTDAEIIRALEVEGFSIDRKLIVLENPIEELGIFEVGVRFHPEVLAKFRLWVAKK